LTASSIHLFGLYARMTTDTVGNDTVFISAKF